MCSGYTGGESPQGHIKLLGAVRTRNIDLELAWHQAVGGSSEDRTLLGSSSLFRAGVGIQQTCGAGQRRGEFWPCSMEFWNRPHRASFRASLTLPRDHILQAPVSHQSPPSAFSAEALSEDRKSVAEQQGGHEHKEAFL